jgi:hypothetical protein
MHNTRSLSFVACCVVGLLSGIASARAHGATVALALVAEDAQGARAVRVTGGLALRVDDQWHFVCPALFGDTNSPAAGSLADGPIIVAASAGLFLLAADGSVSPHPDPLAKGTGRAVVATSAGLFVLQQRDSMTELLSVQADRASVFWRDARAWEDVAATAKQFQLVRLAGDQIEQVLLSSQGDILATETAPAPATTALVFARLAGDVPYIVAATQGGTVLELGRIAQGKWVSLQTGRSNLAGPIVTAKGQSFVAVEGALARFENEQLTPLSTMEFVNCLREDRDHAYACTHGGLRELGAAGLGTSLFELSMLRPPLVGAVPASATASCDAQWQHLQFDLLAAGILVAPGTESDAGPGADAGPSADGGALPGVDRDAGKKNPRGRASKGCAVTSRASGAAHATLLACLGVVLYRRRRGVSRSSNVRT